MELRSSKVLCGFGKLIKYHKLIKPALPVWGSKSLKSSRTGWVSKVVKNVLLEWRPTLTTLHASRVSHAAYCFVNFTLSFLFDPIYEVYRSFSFVCTSIYKTILHLLLTRCYNIYYLTVIHDCNTRGEKEKNIMDHDEQFVSRKLLGRYKNNTIKDIVNLGDKFKITIHDSDIDICGEEVILFAKTLEKKYQEYIGNSFIEFLPDGILSRKNPSFSGYKLGAAICKHYGFDVKRFIEAQYHYHDSWKSSEPSLNYVTSLHSEWNSVGRYRSYCDKFKDSIGYFSENSDNISPAFKTASRKPSKVLTEKVIKHYEQMIQFQMSATNKPRKEVIRALAHPHNSYLPLQYLKTLPEYLELLAEDAWGDAVDAYTEIKKLKLKMRFGK